MPGFGLSTSPFLLKEGLIEIGTWSNITTIGNGIVGDPTALFSGENLSYFKQGTTNIEMPRVYAEARAFTPSVKLRKDLIQKDFNFSAELFQYNADIFANAYGLRVQAAYTAAGFTGDLAFVGSDEPVQSFNGYLITSALTDGTPIKFGIWHGKVTTEDLAVALSGTDYAITNYSIESFNHPDFGVTGVDAQKHYGLIWLDNTV